MASLISLPLRLGVRTARASLQATRDLADLGLATLELVGRVLGEPPSHPREETSFDGEPSFDGTSSHRAESSYDEDLDDLDGEDLDREPDPAPAAVAPVVPPAEPEAPFVPPPPPPPPAGPVTPEPPLGAPEDTAVDIGLEPEPPSPDERELVEEFADAGAEDGAGASLRIAPPFEGYDELRAPDVIARLAGADAAELGETELYERMHRSRRTVLDAVARELRRRGGS